MNEAERLLNMLSNVIAIADTNGCYRRAANEMIFDEKMNDFFADAIRTGKCDYKLYRAFYHIRICRMFKMNNYHPRRLKWAKRYLKSHMNKFIKQLRRKNMETIYCNKYYLTNGKTYDDEDLICTWGMNTQKSYIIIGKKRKLCEKWRKNEQTRESYK